MKKNILYGGTCGPFRSVRKVPFHPTGKTGGCLLRLLDSQPQFTGPRAAALEIVPRSKTVQCVHLMIIGRFVQCLILVDPGHLVNVHLVIQHMISTAAVSDFVLIDGYC